MTMEVVPIVNVESFDEIKKRIKLAEPYAKWLQIDVSDGTFTKRVSWHDPKDLVGLETSINIEAHLMINDPEKKLDGWLVPAIKRIIFQLEATKDPYSIIEKCKKAGKEVGISIAPATEWAQLMPFCGKVELFQVLSVNPGPSGQKFLDSSLDKIKYLRQNCPDCIIEVDGGVNKEVALKAAEAGADIVGAASYIYKNDNIEQAIEELKVR